MNLVQPTFPSIPHLSLSLVVSMPVLLTIFGLFLIFYLIVSFTLFYHWIYYGMYSKGVIIVEALFSIVSVLLIIFASLGLYYF